MLSKILLFTSAFIIGSTSAYSAMTISGTRIIFPATEKEVIVRTNNKGDLPALVQVWVDNGNAKENINSVKTPFVVTPPIYRVEPGKGQSVRLIYNGMALPKDKESVFWFNMLEIPPKPKAIVEQRLDLAFRTQIKIFYRPGALSKSSIGQQKDKLKWSVIDDVKRGRGIKVVNSTPYYLSLDTVNVVSRGRKIELETSMVSPNTSSVFYPVTKLSAADSISSLEYNYINDYGAVINQKMMPSANGREFIDKEK